MNESNLTEETPSIPCASGLARLEIDTIDIFVRFAHVVGVSKSVGEIYGLLFISVVPVTLDYIRTKLSMSSGSASQGLRLLRSVGAVRTAYVAGDRRDHFVAETALQKITIGFLREKFGPNLAMQDESVQRLAQMTAEIPRLHRPLVEDRIRILQNWRREARTVFYNLMNGFERNSEV